MTAPDGTGLEGRGSETADLLAAIDALTTDQQKSWPDSMGVLVKLCDLRAIRTLAEALASPPSSVARGAAADVEVMRSLAKQATNGWACYAKRKIELDDIGRLHREIDAIPASPAPLPDAPLNTAQIHAWLGRWIDHLPATAVLELQWLAPLPDAAPVGFDFLAHLHRQRAFSERTFGPGPRSAGVVDHIRRELLEIEAEPAKLSEWMDVTILALDGAWRAGHSPEAIIAALVAKQTKNESRAWPDWRTAPPNKAIEHVRSPSPSSSPAAKEPKP